MNKYHLFKLGYLRLTFQSQVICEYALHIQIYSLRFPFPGVLFDTGECSDQNPCQRTEQEQTSFVCAHKSIEVRQIAIH